MNKNNSRLVAKNRAMSIALRESILDASEKDLRQALRHEGHDFDKEAASAQEVIERSFQNAGVVIPAQVNEGTNHFGEMLTLLRRDRKLSEAKLALQAKVPLEDIQRAESDPNFIPSLRTIARLEDFFKLKERTLAVLVGKVRIRKDALRFSEGVDRFNWAAFSRGMEKLTREERKQLAEIIRFLGDYTE